LNYKGGRIIARWESEETQNILGYKNAAITTPEEVIS
jgi:hypothetical protein